MKLSPSYLATRTQGQKYALLADDDFLNGCFASDLDPHDVLGLNPDASRTDRCLAPVVMNRTDTGTGEVCEYVIPCSSANAVKCPTCAELQARLRQRQILDGLQREVWVGFLTTTAPSFGPVHRASWTIKNEYQESKLPPSKRDAFRLTILKKNGKCPCGATHTYMDDAVGTPLDPASYDYSGEVIWSENLPALTKSLNRQLRRIAEGLGIARDDLATYAVYERQKRASLHQHTLITVQGSKEVFDLLMDELKNNWLDHAPTAQIPQNKVDFYRSGLAQQRWEQFNEKIPQKIFNPDVSIPMVRWKRGELKPGTQFGTVYDVRPLAPTKDEDDPNLSGYEQAGGYLAKYLTKNQSALALDAIALQSPRLAKHYQGIRQATLALVGDRIIAEGLLSPHLARQKELVKVLAGINGEASFVATEGALASVADIRKELKEVDRAVAYFRSRVENIQASPLVDQLFPNGATVAVGTKQLTNHSDPDVRLAGRGMAIRLNKALNNGGFSGSLTSISNWVTTMTDLKEQMRDFVRSGKPQDDAEYVWELNIEEMRRYAVDRAKPKGFSPRQLMDAQLAEDKLKRLEDRERRREEAEASHERILAVFPGSRCWEVPR